MTYFFTLLDDSLRPRGSRDPLGIEMIWSHVGRKLVGNLTTVTSHLDNFIVTLVGFYLCGDNGRAEPDWELFERFEQVTSRARVDLSTGGVLGVRRIEKSRSADPIPLGPIRAARILEDPKRAGLWGLYSSALSATRLTNRERMLADEGVLIAETFLKGHPLGNWWTRVESRSKSMPAQEMADLKKWVRTVLSSVEGRDQLSKKLLSGGGGGTTWQEDLFLQGQLFVAKTPTRSARGFLHYLSENSPLLKDFARRTLLLDEQLALMNRVFLWLLGCHGKSSMVVIKEVAKADNWPKDRLATPEFPEITDAEWTRRAAEVERFTTAVRGNDWESAINSLLAYHAGIVKARGSVPWVYVERESGQIKVVVSETPTSLPPADQLKKPQTFERWLDPISNGFFLSSFLSILEQSLPANRKAI